MSRRSFALVILAAGILSMPAARTQTLSGSFAANPVQVGQVIQLTVTDMTGIGFLIQGSSGFGMPIRAGTPLGPIVFQPQMVTTDIILIPPNGSFLIQWNQLDNNQQQVPPGTYYFTPGIANLFPITIQSSPQDPSLVQTGSAQVNQTLTMSLSAPNQPGAPYVTAFSFTTNTGFAIGPLFVSLDPDILFSLSVPVPTPPFFGNTFGTLDLAGNAAGIALNSPNVSSLAYRGVAAQAAFIDFSGQLALTNPLVFSIAP